MHRPTAALALTLATGVAAPAAADDLIYFEEDGGAAGPRGLYNFNPGTGISTLRVTVGGTQRFFGLDTQPSTGRVFATAVPNPPTTLWNLDIDTGVATLIGPINNDTIADIAFDPTSGRLYGMHRNDPFQFYSIDPNTGTPTFIGNSSAAARCGLVCSAAGQLYAFSIGGVLATVDKLTGAATVVGGSPVTSSVVEDATFTPSGELYFTTFDGHVYRVDPTTGLQTHVGMSGSGSGLLGIIAAPGGAPCYANCDASTQLPVLNVNDFVCFQSRFAAADPYADCNHDNALNVNDFVCFQAAFAAGCP
jgi:outer membrane protein assembly factor BamB